LIGNSNKEKARLSVADRQTAKCGAEPASDQHDYKLNGMGILIGAGFFVRNKIISNLGFVITR
jgi:hypothetical protein